MTKKRLEIAKLAGRVHVGEQALRAPDPLDPAFLHEAHPDFVEQTQQRQATLSQPSYHGGMAPACIHRAQRIIAAFGLRNDGVAVSPILPPG